MMGCLRLDVRRSTQVLLLIAASTVPSITAKAATTYLTYQWGISGDVPEPGDYDGDGKTDIAVYRRSTGIHFVLLSSTNFATYRAYSLGLSTDIPVPGDYDGDGKTDIAIWRASTGDWWIINSSNGSITHRNWGVPGAGDIPLPSVVK